MKFVCLYVFMCLYIYLDMYVRRYTDMYVHTHVCMCYYSYVHMYIVPLIYLLDGFLSVYTTVCM